jgi:hypothetical protein
MFPGFGTIPERAFKPLICKRFPPDILLKMPGLARGDRTPQRPHSSGTARAKMSTGV